MNHDSMTPVSTAHEAQLASAMALSIQAGLALLAAFIAYPVVPPTMVGGWLAVIVAATVLRRRFTALALWVAGGLAWGLGVACVLHLTKSGPGITAAATAVALAPLFATFDPAPTNRHFVLLAATICLPPAVVMLSLVSSVSLPTVGLLALAAVGAGLLQRQRAALAGELATECALRVAHERALEHLEDEARRLRVETRAVGESNDTLSGELTNATQELAVLRSKAGALSNVLQRINPYDTETGLLTAEKFANVMNREWARMQRQELPISLLLVSLDRFDDFRERQGRLGYEAALRRISDVLRHAGNRPGDVAARLGPGAFALLFPETEHKHVSRLADAVRTRVRHLAISIGPGTPSQVLTATVGMATVMPNNDITPETLRERVEAALYEAQFQGGDRCVRYRTMDSIRVEHWDPGEEGQLTADSLRHKLAVLGYDAQAKTYRPGEQAPSRRVPVDSVEAVVEGQLRILLEGEARVLKPGDLLFIPKGLVTSVEVVGKRSVLCLEAIRA